MSKEISYCEPRIKHDGLNDASIVPSGFYGMIAGLSRMVCAGLLSVFTKF